MLITVSSVVDNSPSFRMITAVLLLFYLCISNQAIASNPKLVIDHDGGADDAMAIFMALLYEEHFEGPQVVGLTTSHGNVNESQVFINSQRILDIANRRDVPIYRGRNSSIVYTYPSDFFFGYDGLGDLEDVTYEPIEAQSLHAVLALVELSKKYEGDLIIVAIGALTNIALAMTLDPQFITRVSQLYLAAGDVYSAADKYPEFNAEVDVEAYYIVAEKSLPEKVTFIPSSQLKYTLNYTTNWRENVLGSIPTDIMRAQNDFERLSIVKKDTWYLLDPAAMAIALDGNIVDEIRYSNNSIILCGDKRGINRNHFTIKGEANAKLVYAAADKEYYRSHLIKVFSAEL